MPITETAQNGSACATTRGRSAQARQRRSHRGITGPSGDPRLRPGNGLELLCRNDPYASVMIPPPFLLCDSALQFDPNRRPNLTLARDRNRL